MYIYLCLYIIINNFLKLKLKYFVFFQNFLEISWKIEKKYGTNIILYKNI